MKRTHLIHAAVAASMSIALASPALAAGVAVQVGEPGYYGRIEIGDAPKPVLVSPSPVIIEREHVVEQPTYIYVPADQRNDWKNYCGRYDACSRPVYFVEDRWYTDVYVPHYKSSHELRKDAKRDYKDEKRDAKREYKDAKEEAKRDYKDAKRESRD